MIIEKYAHKALLVGLGSLLSLGLAIPASLASTSPEAISSITGTKENSTNTPRQGLPGRRLGGGTRGDRTVFTDAYAYLAALTTPNNLSLTTVAQPTLLFSIPEMASAQTAEFILRDSSGENVYQATFSLGDGAGIASLDLSQTTAAPLRLDEDYRWYFSIVDSPSQSDRAKDIVVHGNIRRVAGTSQSAKAIAAMPIEEAIATARALHQAENRWHDAAVMLHALQQANPGSSAIAAEWNQLVEFAGLSAVLQPSTSPIQIALK